MNRLPIEEAKASAGNPPRSCSTPFCVRPAMRSAGVGTRSMHCRYHVQFKARHGSHWHPTYKAGELKPYLTVAAEWIDEQREEVPVAILSRASGAS